MKTLVCRCEDVTLHELTDAMDRGYKGRQSSSATPASAPATARASRLALSARLIRAAGGEVDKPITPRPPYHPVSLAVLAGLADADLPNPEPGAVPGNPALTLTAGSS